MRITRFLDEQGRVRAGADHGDGTADVLASADGYSDLERTGERVSIGRLLAPIAPTNIFCIGLNYRRHAEETGAALPSQPVIFMKPTSTVHAPGVPIRVPACCVWGPEIDYEGELAVVIGKEGRDIPEEHALTHVLGYTVAHDVSARRWQKNAGGGQWIRGKAFDTFCPLGPAVVTTDEIPDPQQLSLQTDVNERRMQDSHTSDMIFSVASLVAFLSQDTTLLPGTVILTGTPEGVGFTRNPPVWLGEGDRVRITIDGIGTLENPVVDASG